MIWQDVVIAICTFAFSVALIPQIHYNFIKKSGSVTYLTGGITFFALYVLAFCFFTLNLYFSFAMNFIAGSLWFVLYLQSLKYGVK